MMKARMIRGLGEGRRTKRTKKTRRKRKLNEKKKTEN